MLRLLSGVLRLCTAGDCVLRLQLRGVAPGGEGGGGSRTRGVDAEDDAGDAGVVGEVTQLPDERLGGDLAGLRLAAAGDVALRTHDRNDPLAGQAKRRRRHCTAAAGVTAMLVARDAR